MLGSKLDMLVTRSSTATTTTSASSTTTSSSNDASIKHPIPQNQLKALRSGMMKTIYTNPTISVTGTNKRTS